MSQAAIAEKASLFMLFALVRLARSIEHAGMAA